MLIHVPYCVDGNLFVERMIHHMIYILTTNFHNLNIRFYCHMYHVYVIFIYKYKLFLGLSFSD